MCSRDGLLLCLAGLHAPRCCPLSVCHALTSAQRSPCVHPQRFGGAEGDGWAVGALLSAASPACQRQRIHERTFLGLRLTVPASDMAAAVPSSRRSSSHCARAAQPVSSRSSPRRFSSDLNTVDDSLPFIANILLANAFSLLGIVAVLLYTEVSEAAAHTPPFQPTSLRPPVPPSAPPSLPPCLPPLIHPPTHPPAHPSIHPPIHPSVRRSRIISRQALHPSP